MLIKEKALEEIKKIYSRLIRNPGYNITHIEQKQYNYEFVVSEKKEKVKILVYFGKNGVKTVYQGNSDSKIYLECAGEKLKTQNQNSVMDLSTKTVIGCDESGKGDFFGPLVVASYFADSEINNDLIKIGVRDSKKLTDEQINNMFDKLKNIGNNFEYRVIEPSEYNNLYEKYKNLNHLLNAIHSNVADKLLLRYKPDNIILDKFSKEKLYLINKSNDTEIIYETGAEKYLAVAAASIVARAKFNEWFQKEDVQELGLLKGAGLEVEKKTQSIKRINGEQIFVNYAKLHFKTLKKI